MQVAETGGSVAAVGIDVVGCIVAVAGVVVGTDS